jgi:hypothetical protein
MDPKLLYEVMRVSTARCWSVDTYNPVPGIIFMISKEFLKTSQPPEITKMDLLAKYIDI